MADEKLPPAKFDRGELAPPEPEAKIIVKENGKISEELTEEEMKIVESQTTAKELFTQMTGKPSKTSKRAHEEDSDLFEEPPSSNSKIRSLPGNITREEFSNIANDIYSVVRADHEAIQRLEAATFMLRNLLFISVGLAVYALFKSNQIQRKIKEWESEEIEAPATDK